MAGGFAKDGAVQEQIDATIEDAVKRARSEMPKGESLSHCEECDAEIPEARREAVASAVAEVLRAHETDEGIVMDGAFWIVTARNPG